MYNLEQYLKAPIYLGTIAGEIQKPQSFRCFPGAWYYKSLSAKDKWLGIEGIVRLPLFIPDEERYEIIDDNFSRSKKYKKYLDTPSVYVGGSSDFETDIGFAWFRGVVNGEVTDDKITFRPFWRYIYLSEGKEKNEYKSTELAQSEYYFFPGDEVKINVICTEKDYLQLRIELVKPTDIPKYQNIRNSLPKETAVFLTDKIPAPGNGHHHSEYKRVNAIDQYHNEGKPTSNTKAQVLESVWKEVYLYREVDNKLVKVPFTEERYVKMLCPEPNAFCVTTLDNYEVISIRPNKK